MDDVLQTPDGKHVAVLVKVLKLGDKEEVKPGLYKRDAIIADAKSHMRLTLWKTDTDKLEEGKTYRLHNLVVKSFSAVKYLTTPKAGLQNTREEDMGNVVNPPQNSSETDHNVLDAEVLGVEDITKRVLCIKCRSTVDQIDRVVGICSRCSLSQRTDRCPLELVARLLVGSKMNDFGEARTFIAFQKAIQSITKDEKIDGATSDEMITTALLNSKTFNFTYNGNVLKTVAGQNN